MSIDLRSGTGAFGVMADLNSPPLHTTNAQRTQIQILPPLPGCPHSSPHFHKQSLALQALRGGAPLTGFPACRICGLEILCAGVAKTSYLMEHGLHNCEECDPAIWEAEELRNYPLRKFRITDAPSRIQWSKFA